MSHGKLDERKVDGGPLCVYRKFQYVKRYGIEVHGIKNIIPKLFQIKYKLSYVEGEIIPCLDLWQQKASDRKPRFCRTNCLPQRLGSITSG